MKSIMFLSAILVAGQLSSQSLMAAQDRGLDKKGMITQTKHKNFSEVSEDAKSGLIWSLRSASDSYQLGRTSASFPENAKYYTESYQTMKSALISLNEKMKAHKSAAIPFTQRFTGVAVNLLNFMERYGKISKENLDMNLATAALEYGELIRDFYLPFDETSFQKFSCDSCLQTFDVRAYEESVKNLIGQHAEALNRRLTFSYRMDEVYEWAKNSPSGNKVRVTTVGSPFVYLYSTEALARFVAAEVEKSQYAESLNFCKSDAERLADDLGQLREDSGVYQDNSMYDVVGDVHSRIGAIYEQLKRTNVCN
jgi:hypothetical protein